jgi:hypothetical protein
MEETFKILKYAKALSGALKPRKSLKDVPCPIQKSYFISSTSQGGII